MRTTAYSILVFYVVLNISLWFVAETQVLPYYGQPYENPTNIYNILVGGFLTLALTTIAGWLFGYALLGGTAGFVLFALQLFVGENSIFYWVFYGVPEFLSQFAEYSGVPATVVTLFSSIILALTSVVWFWFIISFISGRYIET